MWTLLRPENSVTPLYLNKVKSGTVMQWGSQTVEDSHRRRLRPSRSQTAEILDLQSCKSRRLQIAEVSDPCIQSAKDVAVCSSA